MKNILVYCRGFIGDILFASSLAPKLIEKYGSDVTIDYYIPLPQPKLLLDANPYINRVFIPTDTIKDKYWKFIQIPEVDQSRPATIQFQEAAGIENPTLPFDVYIPDKILDEAELQMKLLREHEGNPIVILYAANWEWKAYQCSPEWTKQYRKGKGPPHREIDTRIIPALNAHFCMIPVGFGKDIDQSHPSSQNPELLARTAAWMKFADYMIGPEGGLTNLSAAVGCKTIITTDFIWQLYGPHGMVRPTSNPQMGPAVYYPNEGHVHLHPYIKDNEIVNEIMKIVYDNNPTHNITNYTNIEGNI